MTETSVTETLMSRRRETSPNTTSTTTVQSTRMALINNNDDSNNNNSNSDEFSPWFESSRVILHSMNRFLLRLHVMRKEINAQTFKNKYNTSVATTKAAQWGQSSSSDFSNESPTTLRSRVSISSFLWDSFSHWQMNLSRSWESFPDSRSLFTDSTCLKVEI